MLVYQRVKDDSQPQLLRSGFLRRSAARGEAAMFDDFLMMPC